MSQVNPVARVVPLAQCNQCIQVIRMGRDIQVVRMGREGQADQVGQVNLVCWMVVRMIERAAFLKTWDCYHDSRKLLEEWCYD